MFSGLVAARAEAKLPPAQPGSHTCASLLGHTLFLQYNVGYMPHTETVVMSVGGSLIVPDQIDTLFLAKFKELINKEVHENGRRFIIIAGGGKTARRYQEAARTIGGLTSDDLDWLGLHATRLNGHLLRTVFRDLAYRVMVTNPDEVLDVPPLEKVIIAAGYRPGSSTDLRAIQIAERIGAKKVINLSDIDYIYKEDPRENPDAERIEEIDWEAFRKLIPEEWDPGLSAPFDPIAAKEAQKLEIEVAQINGQKLSELVSYLNEQPFMGTHIHN